MSQSDKLYGAVQAALHNLQADGSIDRGFLAQTLREIYQQLAGTMCENEKIQRIAIEATERNIELGGIIKHLTSENERLREALGNISRMTTLPDHASNTFTLAMAHRLADDALACNKPIDNELLRIVNAGLTPEEAKKLAKEMQDIDYDIDYSGR